MPNAPMVDAQSLKPRTRRTDGIRPVAEGLVMGLVLVDFVEMATRRAFTKPLPAIDASVMALVPLPFLLAAIIACYLPPRRATSVDPNVALRHT